MDEKVLYQIRKFLKELAHPFNWGYIDESGCSKGAGEYTDAWIGNVGRDHPKQKAELLLLLIDKEKSSQKGV